MGAAAERRVVVTGQGVVSCLGLDVDEFYSNLCAVRSNELDIFLAQLRVFCYDLAAKPSAENGAAAKRLERPQSMVLLQLGPYSISSDSNHTLQAAPL